MKLISFTLTPTQIRAQTKTVARRLGWSDLAVGTRLQPCIISKNRHSQSVARIGRPIRVVDVRREPLSRILDDPAYGTDECAREGFPEMSPEDFVSFFMRTRACAHDSIVTRIEFEYRRQPREPQPRICRVCASATGVAIDPSVSAYYCPECIRTQRIICPRCASLPHRVRGAVCDVCGLAYRDVFARHGAA